jgi:hypothetical protein
MEDRVLTALFPKVFQMTQQSATIVALFPTTESDVSSTWRTSMNPWPAFLT